jgi:acetylornithine deacetylase/succinyl-diaminopimelate desuccinylase-like protein
MASIRECLAAEEDLVDAEVSFPFRHDCHVTPPDAMIVREALRAAEAAGIAPRLSVFPASNDAWLYATLLGIPVILFGAGRLEDAHASGERIALAEVNRASRMLRALIAAFCGVVRP